MEQTLEYRGVVYVVGIETDGMRAWSVYDKNAKRASASGLTRARGVRGSFKSAVLAARAAIDEMLGDAESAPSLGAPAGQTAL